MRNAAFLLCVFSILLPWSRPAQAQATVDLRALDQAGPTVPQPKAQTPAPPARPQTAQPSPAKPASVAKPAPPAAPAAPIISEKPLPALPTVAPAPPPPSTMMPPPAAAQAPKPPPVRLIFEAGQTTLSPQDEAAIRALAHAIPSLAASSVNVLAYAAGKPDDPSTARRLSLSRGLAVRAILLDSGIPSAQIYVRALGSKATDNPVDRVDLTVARIGEVTP